MNASTDHFASHVDDADFRENVEPSLTPGDVDHDAAHLEGMHDFPEEKPKRKIPKPVLIVGGIAVFMAVGGVYNHFKAKPDTGFGPLAAAPATSGGMIPSSPAPGPAPAPVAVPPAPTPPAALARADAPDDASLPATIGPLPTVERSGAGTSTSPGGDGVGQTAAQTPAPVGSDAARAPSSPQGAGIPATQGAGATRGQAAVSETSFPVAASNATPARADAPASSAPGVDASDPRDAKIARLEHELSLLRAQPGTGSSVQQNVGDASEPNVNGTSVVREKKYREAKKRVAHTKRVAGSQRASNVEGTGEESDLSSLHIKQVIPGQGWVENESTGKQVVLGVGDRIGKYRVTKIDADGYRIVTTGGVIE